MKGGWRWPETVSLVGTVLFSVLYLLTGLDVVNLGTFTGHGTSFWIMVLATLFLISTVFFMWVRVNNTNILVPE